MTRYEVPNNEYLPERPDGRFVLVKELNAVVKQKAHEIAKKICGSDPAYCFCDGLHSAGAIEDEIKKQLMI